MCSAAAGLHQTSKESLVHVVCKEVAVAVFVLFFRKGIKELIGLHGLSEVGRADSVIRLQ